MNLVKANQLYNFIHSCPLCNCGESIKVMKGRNTYSNLDPAIRPYFLPYEKDHFFLRQCTACTFIFPDRLPSDNKYFLNLYNCVNWDFSFEYNFHGKIRIFNQIKKILLRHIPHGKLLDIGCFCGTFLNFLSDGYDMVGSEINTNATNFAISNGFDVRKGSFLDTEFPLNEFDVITMIDVLEHLPAPKDVLKKAYALLKDDGILFIKVPNGKGQIIKELLFRRGVASNFIHINLFSHIALSHVLEEIGFYVIEKGFAESELYNLDACNNLQQKVSRWFVNQSKMLCSNFINRVARIPFCSSFGLNIYIIAQKKSHSHSY